MDPQSSVPSLKGKFNELVVDFTVTETSIWATFALSLQPFNSHDSVCGFTAPDRS